MADTIFGKIVRGEIPCNKVYEDDKVIAFLDINPLSAGHTLVVPKEPAETMDGLSDESAAALGRVRPRLCRAVVAAPASRNTTYSKITARARTRRSTTCTFTSFRSRTHAKGWESAGPRKHSTARLPPLSPRRSLNQFSEPQTIGVRVASPLVRADRRPLPALPPRSSPLDCLWYCCLE